MRRLPVIIAIILFAFCCPLSAQEKYLHFTEIDGLPRNITTCLEQDKYGYLWIGTTNGMARYDGNTFDSYQELTGTGIIHLFTDASDRLWTATDKGLYRYNRLRDHFELAVSGYIQKVQEDRGNIYFLMISNIYRLEGNKATIVYEGENVNDFCFSEEGIWLGNNEDGVWFLENGSEPMQLTETFLPDKSISIVRKIKDHLFAGCYNGELYAISNKRYVSKIDLQNQDFFEEIVEAGEEIWLATDGNGIIILDKDFHVSRTLSRDRKTEASLNSNSIYDILPGYNQEIWIASYGAGLTCILPDNLLFQNLAPEKGNENSLVDNEGVSVFVGKEQIFFGTNYGLSVWNEDKGEFRNLPGERLSGELNGIKVTAIYSDKNDHLWIGTYDGLLGKYSPDLELIETFHPCSADPDAMQQIVGLHAIPENKMLILTQFRSHILINFDLETRNGDVFELYNKGSNQTYCLLNSLRENQQGELLAVIRDQGLFHVNWVDNVLENRLAAMNRRIQCPVTDFFHDKRGHYWVTSSSDGLLCVSEDGNDLRKWTVKDGLPTNNLVRIESVDDRYLWISSLSGICRFDTQTEEVLIFNANDGLPANEFLERISSLTHDGRIIFGSLSGFTIIDPTKAQTDVSGTEIIISDITFQDQSIRNADGEQFLSKPLEETREISLPYNKNSFSIHFFVKNKPFLKNHNYTYRLVGLDNNWSSQWKINQVTYTNLSPGTYTFEILTADKTNEGNPTRLIIHIRPPWYLTWYAYLAYAVIFITLVFLAIYALMKRLELKKEKVISEFKVQKEHELTEKKMEFVANISHDLKTPLTLIDAPVSDLLHSGNLDREQVHKLELIRRNTKRLYSLILDLLDFRKLTNKQFRLEVRETDIYPIFEEACNAFQDECLSKSITLESSVEKGLKAFADAEKIKKILWNLLSNAIKFTNTGGNIQISAEELNADGNRRIKLVVRDNGVGIPEKDRKHIFTRFYKADNSKIINKQGTGIGLSIVKELIDMHHGAVGVESAEGSGTTFTITIPAGKESYSDDEIVPGDTSNRDLELNELAEVITVDTGKEKEPSKMNIKHYNLPGILVVEDNAELREYLAGHLNKTYRVYEAEDGHAGFRLAKEHNPDIILTDIQMPVMDGLEFCREIRRHFDTSHIPVIMLTANDTIDHQIEGLSTGADAYLTKPFDIKLLDTVLSTLLDNRRKLRKKFSGLETAGNMENALPPKDIEFIDSLKLFIEENMMNPDLNVETLSAHFAVSLAQLNRKIKSLTDHTPNNLIKSIRIRKAYQLILEEGLRVSEAAYQTGFSDPNYFTTCFKKEFGINPSQIR